MSDMKVLLVKKRFPYSFAGYLKDQKGVTLILVAGMMLLLLGVVAIAIDVGYYMVGRNELQNIADAAALAGCRKLGADYQSMSLEEQRNYECNRAAIVSIAQEVGLNNNAGGSTEGITILDGDVIIGTWDGTELSPGLNQPDAVKVTARRDASANSPITTFFFKIFDVETMSVFMDATAALTGQGTTDEGELELPVGISKWFFESGHGCNDYIVFHPSNDPNSCAGWNVWDESPASAATLKDILNGEITSPETISGDTEFAFTGGDVASSFDELLLLFMRKGYDTQADGVTPAQADGDGNPLSGALPDGAEGTVPLMELNKGVLERAYYPDDNKNPTPRNLHRWETSVVVYDLEDCSNPTGSIKIVGYAKIALTNVQVSPDKKIVGQILCDLFSNFDTRGGGGEFGVKGTIPGLVE